MFKILSAVRCLNAKYLKKKKELEEMEITQRNHRKVRDYYSET